MTTAEIEKRRSTPAEEPSEETPEIGKLVVSIGDEQTLISKIEWWRDGDVYMVRSREYDCVADGDSRDAAFSAFVENTFAYARQLEQLIEQGAASDAETETFHELRERLFDLMLAERSKHREARRRGLLGRVIGGGGSGSAVAVR